MNAVACFTRSMETPESSLTSLVGSYATLVAGGFEDALVRRNVARKVDVTIKSVTRKAEQLEAIATMGYGLAKQIRDSESGSGVFLDPELELFDSLTKIKSSTEDLSATCRSRKPSIDRDRHLSPRQRLMLHAAYNRLLAANTSVNQAMDALIAAIEFHDESNVEETMRGIASFEEMAYRMHGNGAVEIQASFDGLARSEQFTLAGAKKAFSPRRPKQA